MSVMNGASGSSVLPAGRWSVDATRSSVAFAAGHMTLATVNGRFQEFDGALEIGSGTPRATGVVRAASIDTDEPIRAEHLRRSRDFFDVGRYPEITIRSTRIDYLDGGRLRVVGDLTMRGVTREIALDARLGTRPEVVGDRRVELELRGELRRRDFGLTWNTTLEAGGVLAGEDVTVTLDVEFIMAAQ